MAVLAVLLAISVTVNLVIFVYHSWKGKHDTRAGKNGHEEQLNEQVTKTQLEEVVMEDNECYIRNTVHKS